MVTTRWCLARSGGSDRQAHRAFPTCTLGAVRRERRCWRSGLWWKRSWSQRRRTRPGARGRATPDTRARRSGPACRCRSATGCPGPSAAPRCAGSAPPAGIRCLFPAWRSQNRTDLRGVHVQYQSLEICSFMQVCWVHMQVYGGAAAAYGALADHLRGTASKGNYFFGAEPCSLDAAIFAHLALHHSAPVSAPELRQKVVS